MAPLLEILLGLEYFDPFIVQSVLVVLQLLLLPLQAASGGDETSCEALLCNGVFGDYIVLGAKALILLGLRHVIVICPFKEVAGILVFKISIWCTVMS